VIGRAVYVCACVSFKVNASSKKKLENNIKNNEKLDKKVRRFQSVEHVGGSSVWVKASQNLKLHKL